MERGMGFSKHETVDFEIQTYVTPPPLRGTH